MVWIQVRKVAANSAYILQALRNGPKPQIRSHFYPLVKHVYSANQSPSTIQSNFMTYKNPSSLLHFYAMYLR